MFLASLLQKIRPAGPIRVPLSAPVAYDPDKRIILVGYGNSLTERTSEKLNRLICGALQAVFRCGADIYLNPNADATQGFAYRARIQGAGYTFLAGVCPDHLPPKVSPNFSEAVMAQYGVRPQQVMVVDDDPTVIKVAGACGMFTVLVNDMIKKETPDGPTFGLKTADDVASEIAEKFKLMAKPA